MELGWSPTIGAMTIVLVVVAPHTEEHQHDWVVADMVQVQILGGLADLAQPTGPDTDIKPALTITMTTLPDPVAHATELDGTGKREDDGLRSRRGLGFWGRLLVVQIVLQLWKP